MSLASKSDYRYVTIDERVPDFTGRDLVPANGQPMKIETLSHLVEELAERAALLYIDVWSPDVFPRSWPYPLYGWQLGRCQAMWDEDSTKGRVVGERPKYGGTGGRAFNDLFLASPSVVGAIRTESDLLALYPSSDRFPAQEYGESDGHMTITEPYRSAVGGNALYRIYDHGFTWCDLIHDCIGLVYGFETTGLTKTGCGKMDFESFPETDKDMARRFLPTIFSAPNGKYMAFMISALAEIPLEGYGLVSNLLWSEPASQVTTRFYISGSATTPGAGGGFQICGGYATYHTDYTSNPLGEEVEDSLHPLSVLVGSTYPWSGATAQVEGSSLSRCMEVLYPLSEKPNQGERAATALALVNLLHPGISGYSIHVATPSGGLANSVFGDSRISPQAMVYADNLLAKCEKVLVTGMSLGVYDENGQSVSGRSTDYYRLSCGGSYFGRLILTDADLEELPDGYYVEGGVYKQRYSPTWCGKKGKLVWSGARDEVTDPVMSAYRTEDAIPADGHVTIGHTYFSKPMTGSEFSECVVGLWFSAHVEGSCFSNGWSVGERIEIVEEEVPVPGGGTFQYEVAENADVYFPGCDSRKTWERRPFASRDATVNFFMWVRGEVVVVDTSTEASQSSEIRVKIDLPDLRSLVARANSAVAAAAGNPFTVPEFTSSQSSILNKMVDFTSQSRTDVMDAQGASWMIGGDPEVKPDFPSGQYGTVTSNFAYTLSISLAHAGPVFYRVSPRSGTLRNP